MTVDDVAARFEALGNPTRLEIVRILVRTGERGLAVGALRERLGIAASTLSHHLSRLVTVGLVRQERQSTTLICKAELHVMRETADYLIEECCADVGMSGPTGAGSHDACAARAVDTTGPSNA